MNIEERIQQAAIDAVKTLYGMEPEKKMVQLQKTRAEFEGNLTLVVFPFVKIARKSPEQVGEEIGKELVEHSGLICFDFDHLNHPEEVRRILLADTYFETLLLFVSPSGNGLKWVIGIDLQQASHEQWFQAVSNYLKFTYQLDADPACRNVSRACFLPHDPECYIAPRLLPELKQVLQTNPEVEELMNNLAATNIIVEQLNPANQYDQL